MLEDEDEQSSSGLSDRETEIDPVPREALKRAKKDQELREQEATVGQTQDREMSGRPSPKGLGNKERTSWKETDGRSSPDESKSPDAELRKDEYASATRQSTPFFVGTSHKELRALLNARNNSEAWAAMLEQEHPAQDYCDAYQALQQNQDPKQSVLFTLLYYQNEQWLQARQIAGPTAKVTLRHAENSTVQANHQGKMLFLTCHMACCGQSLQSAVQTVMLLITILR
jgi:hypothetical protein